MRAFVRVVCGVLVAALCAGGAWAQDCLSGAKCVALVIGNGVYAGHPDLTNTAADAQLIAATLDNLGFDVELLIDARKAEMEAAFLRLNQRLKAEGEDAVGLFYFAGHGVQSQGLNYLLPVDSTARVEPQVWAQAPRLGLLMDFLADAENAVNFIILDACRDNPLPAAGRTQAGGLASAGRVRGTLIAYATAPGFTASDGPGQPNSPFTAALAQLLPTPGWNAETLFKQVATVVENDTMIDGVPAQSPWYENGLRGADFCFAGCGAGGAAVVAAPAVDPDRARLEAELAALRAENEQLAALGRGTSALTPSTPPTVDRPATGSSTSAVTNRPVAGSSTSVVVDRPVSGSRTAEQARRAAEAGRPVEERTFRDCDVCPEMVVIPAGSFVMGSLAGEAPARNGHEGPQRTVRIGAFAAGKLEVTFDEWNACAAGGGCDGHRPSDAGWGQGTRPVINVSWNDAQAYVRWLNSQPGVSGYRLLTEAEWEYAARAGTSGAYWWGGSASHEYANYGSDTTASGLASGRDAWVNTSPAGAFAANAFGLHDTHGNVSEWVQDCYVRSYSEAPTDGSAVTTGDCSRRVFRGGNWGSYPHQLRSASRNMSLPGNRLNFNGFRVARTL